MRRLLFLLLAAPALSFCQFTPQGSDRNLKVNNTILARVNGSAISVVDVMKKLEVIFRQAAPHLVNTPAARYQFFAANWQHVLDEMINIELIVADSESKEMKLSDGEIREEMEQRFGPNILLTLADYNLTYDEAWKMVKRDIIVSRMTWYYVNSKALQTVSPQTLRQRYRQFCKENPTVEKWNYQIISVRDGDGDSARQAAAKVYAILKKEGLEGLQNQMEALQTEFKECAIQVSNPYEVKSRDLNEENRTILGALPVNSFSAPAAQTSKFTNKTVFRIFHLKNYQKIETPSFDAVSVKLREDLLQTAAQKLLSDYHERLHNFYDHDGKGYKEPLPEKYQPFAFE